MKRFLRAALLLLAAVGCCVAWDTAPHRAITKAALDAMPERLRSQLGDEAPHLIRIYCMLPDRYVEMERFGFARNSPGPREASEIEAYCARPDGSQIHSATWDRDEDLKSLVYLFERILSSLSEKRPAEAARFMGTLSHFIADSLSPPHAVSPDELQAMAPAGSEQRNWHALMERSLPAFTLDERKTQAAGTGIMDSVSSILERVYTAGERNRKDLPSMMRAAPDKDERALDAYRLRAGRAAAGILADTLYTLLAMGGQ